MFEKIIFPSIGNIDLLALLPIHKNDVIEQANRYGKSAPRHAIITLRRMIHYAKKCRIPVGVTPEEIEIPTYRVQKDVCAWTREEIVQAREILSRDYSDSFSKHATRIQRIAHKLAAKRTYALFELMLHSGLRLSEALSVNREDINWEQHEMRVEDCKEKGTWKTVFLHGAEAALAEYLETRTDNNQALFANYLGNRLQKNTAQTSLKRLKIRAGKDNKFVRTLAHKTCRSTFITIPLQEGIDPKTVQKWAHHRSLHTTLNYYMKIMQEKLKPMHKEIFQSV